MQLSSNSDEDLIKMQYFVLWCYFTSILEEYVITVVLPLLFIYGKECSVVWILLPYKVLYDLISSGRILYIYNGQKDILIICLYWHIRNQRNQYWVFIAYKSKSVLLLSFPNELGFGLEYMWYFQSVRAYIYNFIFLLLLFLGFGDKFWVWQGFNALREVYVWNRISFAHPGPKKLSAVLDIVIMFKPVIKSVGDLYYEE